MNLVRRVRNDHFQSGFVIADRKMADRKIRTQIFLSAIFLSEIPTTVRNHHNLLRPIHMAYGSVMNLKSAVVKPVAKR